MRVGGLSVRAVVFVLCHPFRPLLSAADRGQKKFCVPKIGLKFPALLITFILCRSASDVSGWEGRPGLARAPNNPPPPPGGGGVTKQWPDPFDDCLCNAGPQQLMYSAAWPHPSKCSAFLSFGFSMLPFNDIRTREVWGQRSPRALS